MNLPHLVVLPTRTDHEHYLNCQTNSGHRARRIAKGGFSMEQRLSIVTLGVADVGRSRRFSEDLVRQASGASNEPIVFFQFGGIVLALYGRSALAEDSRLPADGSGF